MKESLCASQVRVEGRGLEAVAGAPTARSLDTPERSLSFLTPVLFWGLL